MSSDLVEQARLAASSTDDDEARSDGHRLVGRLLGGRWRLVRLLGSGGMSSVYEAVHRDGRRVAIKVLSPELTGNRQIRGRFVREGYIATRIDHPGAVAVLDDESDGEFVYLVMELLQGETLAARAQRSGGRLSPEEVAWVVDDLLGVLEVAHATGIVHRDIKPANVFLTQNGQVKLLDFGIARLREISAGLAPTRSGSALGTPGFMAPEQARGRWVEVDARTDLWAVGAAMYQLLTGQLVHAREYPIETMIAAATQPAPALGSSRPDLPQELLRLVDRALAYEPQQRWQSAREMQEAVRQVRGSLALYQWYPPPPAPELPSVLPEHEGTVAESDTYPTFAARPLTGSVRNRVRPMVLVGFLATGALAVLPLAGLHDRRQPVRVETPAPLPAPTPSPLPIEKADRPRPVVDIVPARPLRPTQYKGRRYRSPPGAPRSSALSAMAPPAPHESPTPQVLETTGSSSEGQDLLVSDPVATKPLPAESGSAGATPAPVVLDAPAAPAPVATPVPRREVGHVISERPRDSIPRPQLGAVFEAPGRDSLVAMCQLVEKETVSRAGVSPEFAYGVTAALQKFLETQDVAEIYPAAMYYFIISEAALGHDREAAGRALLASHRSRALRRLSGMLADRKR